jgi:hypothetical protein
VETTRRASVDGGRSHRLQVRFDAQLLGPIRERSRTSGQSLSAIIRQLVATALSFDTEPGSRTDSPAALAALVAAEHAALMVASVLPDGQRLLQELGAQAARAAEERLAMFRETER